jgi:site-specific DNA recombinase
VKAAIFARVSTAEQAQKGYSLPEQLSVCRKKAEELNCIQVDEFIEDESGAFMETPGLDALRGAIKNNGYRYVIMLDPDRLARNLTRQLVVAGEIERAGAELIFTNYDYDKTAEGRLFFSIKGALSEYEREKIKERTSRGMRRKALSGKVPKSGRPYGYEYNPEQGMYYINEREAEIIQLIFKWIGKERATLYECCRRLAEMGIPTRRSGGIWRTNTIAYIVHNTLYCGEAVAFKRIRKKIAPGKFATGYYPKENWVKIKVPAIVTQRDFEDAQAALRENFINAPRNTKNQYILQGLVYCPVCNYRMGVCYNGRRTITYFFCRTGMRSANKEPRDQSCKIRNVPMQQLEELVFETMAFYAANPDELRKVITKKDILENEDDVGALTSYLDNLKKKQDLLTKEKDKILRIYRKGLIDDATAEKQLDEISKEEKEVKGHIEAIKRKTTVANKQTSDLEQFINSYIAGMKGFAELPYSNKKRVLETFVSKIIARRTDKSVRSEGCKIDMEILFKV